MGFDLYPAIDLLGGKGVRLTQGDYQQETVYGDPLELAQRWIDAGARWLHIVDLDAARSGMLENLPTIKQLVQSFSVPVQVGGGVRDRNRLEQLLELGVSRVVIGSAAIENKTFVQETLGKYGKKVAIGLDAREGKVATHGWLQTTDVSAAELAREMVEYGAETFIFTDISRDGMLSGVNVEAVKELAQACGKDVIASGGVRSLADLSQLMAIQEDGVSGVIVGKALYTGAIQLEEALQLVAEVNGH